MPRAEILVVEDPAAEAAARMADAVRAGGDIVITGGEGPRRTYEMLAAMDLDWSGVTLWLSDERCVDPDDERSNFRLIQETLLSRLGDQGVDARRIPAERGPHEGADAYEIELRARFGEAAPDFDLVLLGMGPDGHCASLFPGQETLHERERLVVGVERAGLEPFVPRVSLTLPALDAAKRILFLITGAEKAEAAAKAFAGPPSEATPSSLVEAPAGTVTALLDSPAAARLPG